MAAVAPTVDDTYSLAEKIGSGAFSDVFRATRIDNPEEVVAIKQIKKAKLKNRDDIKTEIDALQNLSHPHIIRLLEVFDTPDFTYLALEYLSGGELFDRIVERGSYTEQDAGRLISQVLNAIDYLHCQNIVHRDLKPENLLCDSKADDARIVLNDFGLARYLPDGEKLTHPCGTPGYAAPEVLMKKPYDFKADCFSLGVIAYILLCGYPPFFSETDDNAELLDLTVKGEWEFDSPDWDDMSKACKQYISGLMETDPEKRWAAREALEHPWVRGETASSRDIHRRVSQNFAKYFAKKRWRLAFNAQRSINRLRLFSAGRKVKEGSEDGGSGSGAPSPAAQDPSMESTEDAGKIVPPESSQDSQQEATVEDEPQAAHVVPRPLPRMSVSLVADDDEGAEDIESITVHVPPKLPQRD